MAKTPEQLDRIIEFVLGDGELTDTERLDWCAIHLFEVYLTNGNYTITWYSSDGNFNQTSGCSLRDAIDQAINEEKERG